MNETESNSFQKDRYQQFIHDVQEQSSWSSLVSAPKTKDNLTNLMIKVCTVLGNRSTKMAARVRLEDRLFLQLPQSSAKYMDIQQSIDAVKASVQIHQGKKNYLGASHRARHIASDSEGTVKPPNCYTENSDVIEAAVKLREQGEVLVVNFANEKHICGKFNVPFMGSQEEKIAEKVPMLYASLDRAQNPKLKEMRSNKWGGDKMRHIPKRGCVFLPHVPIVRNRAREFIGMDAGPSEKTITLPTINIASVAAIDLRKSIEKEKYLKDGEFNKKGETLTMEKMRSTLRAAKDHNIPNLVLGALGCGAFKNDPVMIAKYWEKVLKEDEFKGCFNTIVFAVYSSNPDTDPNFIAFNERFPNE